MEFDHAHQHDGRDAAHRAASSASAAAAETRLITDDKRRTNDWLLNKLISHYNGDFTATQVSMSANDGERVLHTGIPTEKSLL